MIQKVRSGTISEPRTRGRWWVSPTLRLLAQLISAMEVFLQHTFIVGKKALSLRDSIPPRPKRKKATDI